MMKKLSLVVLALGAVASQSSIAAMAFQDVRQPSAVDFGGKIISPPYQPTWRWYTDSITGLNSKFSEMESDKKTIILKGPAISNVTLLAGYTPMGELFGVAYQPKVVWGAGVTTDVATQELGILKLSINLNDNAGIKLGTAELYMTGVAAVTGTYNYTVTPESAYLIVGVARVNGAARTCGDMVGSGKGLSAANSPNGAPPGLAGMRSRMESLFANVNGFPLAPLPNTTPADVIAYVHTESVRLAAITGKVAATKAIGMQQINIDTELFKANASAEYNQNTAIEFRCGLGFIGDANEKIVLKFDNEITSTTQWKITLTPIVTYS